MSDNHQGLVLDVSHALVLSQVELAKLLGRSRSTIQRFQSGARGLTRDELAILARASFPKDQTLAARAAALGGTTLEELGLVAPKPARQSEPRAAAEPPPPKPPSPHVADSVLCAAAEAMNVPPQEVRPVLRAAFARARDLGLTVEMVAEAFDRVEST